MARKKPQSGKSVTLKIPAELYRNLTQLIDGTGFRSVTEFAVYVLRDVAAGGRLTKGGSDQPTIAPPPEASGLSAAEIDAVRRRLRALGYIE